MYSSYTTRCSRRMASRCSQRLHRPTPHRCAAHAAAAARRKMRDPWQFAGRKRLAVAEPLARRRPVAAVHPPSTLASRPPPPHLTPAALSPEPQAGSDRALASLAALLQGRIMLYRPNGQGVAHPVFVTGVARSDGSGGWQARRARRADTLPRRCSPCRRPATARQRQSRCRAPTTGHTRTVAAAAAAAAPPACPGPFTATPLPCPTPRPAPCPVARSAGAR